MATTINAGRVRFVSRGTYNNSTQYYLFDLVDYNGSSYIAKENSLGNLPTNTQYWQLIAEKGNTGNTGQTGPVGATGNGIASITKTGTSGLVDTYTITYTNGNTTTFTITNGEDGEVTQAQFDDLQQRVEDAENNQLTNTPEIATSHYLQDSADSRFRKFIPIGRTTQESTTGKNKLKVENVGTYNGITSTKNTDGSINLKGTCTGAWFKVNDYDNVNIPAGTYTFSIDTTLEKYIRLNFVYEDDTVGTGFAILAGQKKATQTIDKKIIKIFIEFPSATNFSIDTTVKFQLEEGSTATPYEPYTGGEPAPNPKYPYTIKNTGDNGSVNEKVSNSDGTQEQNISFPLAQGQKLMQGDYPADDEKVHHKRNQIVFNGSESWGVSSFAGYYRVQIAIPSAKKFPTNISTALCNSYHYRPDVFNSNLAKLGQFGQSNTTSTFYFMTDKTLPEFKSDLAQKYEDGTPLILEYELAEETTEDFTEEQKTAWKEWKKARTYKNVTHISSEDETPANVEIEYVRDLETVINNLSN